MLILTTAELQIRLNGGHNNAKKPLCLCVFVFS